MTYTDLDMVRAKIYRMVSNRRARKLRKRGEFVKWSVELDCYIWEPCWLSPNPNTLNGLPWLSRREQMAL